jgi:hypothetical protein
MEDNSTMEISATVPGQLGGFNLSKRFLKVHWVTQLTGNGTTEPAVMVKKEINAWFIDRYHGQSATTAIGCAISCHAS